MAGLIERRYAHALFQLCAENGSLDQTYEQVIDVLEIFKNEPELVRFIELPGVGGHEKMALVEEVFKGKVSNVILGLFNVAFSKERDKEITAVLEMFAELVKESRQFTVARVTSAAPLSEEQKEGIRQTLSRNLNKQVDVESVVDRSLIGGLFIMVDGKVIDGTIKRRLAEIKSNLMDIQLAQKGV